MNDKMKHYFDREITGLQSAVLDEEIVTKYAKPFFVTAAGEIFKIAAIVTPDKSIIDELEKQKEQDKIQQNCSFVSIFYMNNSSDETNSEN